MRTFKLGAVRLVLGDCRDVLPTLPGGASYITDPVWPNVPAGLLPGSDRPDALFRESMEALVDPRRVVVVMRTDSDPRMLRHVPGHMGFFRTIELPYAIPSRVGRRLIGGDVAYCYGPAPAWERHKRIIAGRGPAAQPTKSTGHPCPRPQVHADWLLERLTDSTDLVVDPFVGSGTTAIAAMKAGRAFVGIEIDQGYFEIACRRLTEASRQGDMLRMLDTVAA